MMYQQGRLAGSATNTPANASSGNVANGTATASLAAQASKRNYVTGFTITGAGATAASVVTATLSGVTGGPLHYTVVVPAGVTTAIQPLNVRFDTPIPASADNTAITISVPAFGAGNTNAAATINGFVVG